MVAVAFIEHDPTAEGLRVAVKEEPFTLPVREPPLEAPFGAAVDQVPVTLLPDCAKAKLMVPGPAAASVMLPDQFPWTDATDGVVGEELS